MENVLECALVPSGQFHQLRCSEWLCTAHPQPALDVIISSDELRVQLLWGWATVSLELERLVPPSSSCHWRCVQLALTPSWPWVLLRPMVIASPSLDSMQMLNPG